MQSKVFMNPSQFRKSSLINRSTMHSQKLTKIYYNFLVSNKHLVRYPSLDINLKYMLQFRIKIKWKQNDSYHLWSCTNFLTLIPI